VDAILRLAAVALRVRLRAVAGVAVWPAQRDRGRARAQAAVPGRAAGGRRLFLPKAGTPSRRHPAPDERPGGDVQKRVSTAGLRGQAPLMSSRDAALRTLRIAHVLAPAPFGGLEQVV